MATSMMRRVTRISAVGLLFSASLLQAQTHLTSPQEQFGWTIGADYRLATYTQLTDWWKKLDRQSDRMKLVSIGKTAEGRDQWMAIITSPANQAKLSQYQSIAARLARAEGLTDAQARALARDGKAVVWIDGGLHATEVLGAHQLMEHVWQMVSQNDPETLRILNDVIQLVVHANPDGMELVSSWYMRNPVETERSTGSLPRLYQKYVGHDNNRDFYMNAQPESENMSRIMFREWYPQIVYNHHQTGPAGAVMFAPPFRDPFNYLFDPLIPAQLNVVGALMEARFAAEKKPGTTRRSGANYSTWWNGGLRTVGYFHNVVGILTETIGNPTPVQVPLVVDRQLPTGDLAYPVEPQTWHFRQSIDYSMTANRAILDYASKYREDLLYNIYAMGRNAIQKGKQDTWTPTPKHVALITEAAREDAGRRTDVRLSDPRGTRTIDPKYMAAFRRPELRDPRGYILPSDQPDFPTATKFVNALIKSGVDVHRATRGFTVAGKQYPSGSYVLKAAQAYRAHLLDLMEPQDHPDDIPYPGGPPRPPYDAAGWTLAMQMGVQYDRILDGFDGPFEKLPDVIANPAGGMVAQSSTGWYLSREVNDAVIVANRLLANDQQIRELTAPVSAGSATWPAGTFFIPASSGSRAIVEKAATEKGLAFAAATAAPSDDGSRRLRRVRIGLWDQYGGSMPSGWTRWLLEQFEFTFDVVYPPDLDGGNLRSSYDVLILPDGAVSTGGRGFGGGRGGAGGGDRAESIPAAYRDRLGRITPERTIPKLREFLEAGGTIITEGGSVSLAGLLGLPIGDYLTEMTPDGPARLPREKFYVPGSLMEVAVDRTVPVAWGMGDSAVVMFDESPVMKLPPDAAREGIRAVAWFNSDTSLRSGWAWGQAYLNGGVAAAEARVGSGTLYLLAPRVTYRGQPHGSFKLLFNGILGAGTQRSMMP